jgi:sterol desaturase/sphingolipid hydroxylase (fatty acid hydroxylase superfamily)
MYWWHRLNHRIPFLWRFHRMHHSDPRMDVTTANRFHIGEIALSSILRLPVIALLGLQLWELALYELAMFSVVQLHHANVALPGWLDRALRWIIVTPFMHKVHHSRWRPETDSNYSSLFSFWDRLFRTFRLRDDPRTLRLGLDEFDSPKDHTLVGLLATPIRRVERMNQPAQSAGRQFGGSTY